MQDVQHLLSAASQHATSGQFVAAGDLLEEAAEIVPLDSYVQLCLAAMWLRTGDYPDAVQLHSPLFHLSSTTRHRFVFAKQERAATLAMSFDVDPVAASYALRANARWHQVNLLGAQIDLKRAQEASAQGPSPFGLKYATNMIEA